MTIEQSDRLVTTSRWGRMHPVYRGALVIALIVPLVAVVAADADWVRYAAAAAVVGVALVVGWLRETDGLTIPPNRS